ncbi:MAG: extracellular solute-binding protein [Limnochordaceae bacterium]|nr:extracellular solute-binding protein [Limnochordaceae bacterium]
MPRQIPEQVVEAGAAGLTNRLCCLCQTPLAAADQAVICPRCGSVHHASCWSRNGGCGKVGCPQPAVTLRPETPVRVAPPPAPSFWQSLARWQKATLIGLCAVLLLYAGVSIHRHRLESASVRVRLQVLVPTDLFEDDRYQKLAQQFEEAHPGVRVTVISAPYQGYEQKLLIATAAGDAPDVFMLAPSRAPFYAEHDALLPLDRFWEALPSNLRTAWQRLPWTDGSHVYGLARAPGWPALWVISSRTSHAQVAWDLLVHFLQTTTKDGNPPPGYNLEPKVLPYTALP